MKVQLKKIVSSKRLKELFLFSFGLRFFTHLAAAFVPVFLPEAWRQMDTLGVSLRYYLKFVHETRLPLELKLLPAVLQAGDGFGIMPMEFPILNWVFFPFWMAGPELGKILIYLTLTFLVYGITYALFKTGRGPYRYAFLLFPTVSYATDYFAKFMPDTLSMLLVLAGVVLPFSKLSPKSGWVRASPLWIVLGLLMKPTAVAGLAFFFVIRKINREEILRFLKCSTLPVILAGLYYTFGLKLLRHFSGGVSLFATQIKNPLTSLAEVLVHPTDLYRHFSERTFFFGVFPLVMIAVLLSFRKQRPVFLILIAQFLLILALDGGHSFTHDYYYASLAPTACVLYVSSVFRFRTHVLGFLLLLGLIVRPLELSVKDFVRIAKLSKSTLYSECRQLRNAHPEIPWNQGSSFRSSPEPYPSLGLCFGEKEGSVSAPFGFFYRHSGGFDSIHCTQIDETENFRIARCSN